MQLIIDKLREITENSTIKCISILYHSQLPNYLLCYCYLQISMSVRKEGTSVNTTVQTLMEAIHAHVVLDICSK